MPQYHQLQSHRHCPVCGHRSVDLLYSQVFSTLSSDSLLSGYDVVTCVICGFGFADHIPLQPDFDRYYQNMSKYEFQESAGKEAAFDAARFDVIAEFITPFILRPDAHVLDVGCATGGLLYRIKQRGFENLMGLDPSPTCATLAWNQHQIQVLTGTISRLRESRNKYDFIILVGVLEHIRDLQSHLQVLKSLLTENGRIFVEVPDALRFDRWPDAPYQQFSMEHINFFSPTSLENLMLKNGFRKLHLEQLAREQSRSTVMPVVAAVFNNATMPGAEMQKCEETKPSLLRYIQYSETIEIKIKQTITDLANSDKSILIWGAGTHTLHLMRTSDLPKVKIIAFVDSNPRYQNKEIEGIPVIAPNQISKYEQPILVSSRVFQDDIVNQIRNVLDATNELILLYDV
jgi:cyclopropane fatty-acyl-phospholipid synthase-like methyltransferase